MLAMKDVPFYSKLLDSSDEPNSVNWQVIRYGTAITVGILLGTSLFGVYSPESIPSDSFEDHAKFVGGVLISVA